MKRKAPENYRKDASWANMFDEFLNTPPTASLFRLYLISFIIWNKAVLLYIIFDSSSMGTKLLVDSWRWYVLFGWYSKSCAIISVYLGPIIILAILAVISLINFGKQEKSTVFNWFKKLHIKRVAEIYALEKGVEEEKEAVIEQKEQNIDREFKLNNKIEDIYKNAPAAPQDKTEWIAEYGLFRRTSHFNYFDQFVQNKYLDLKNVFELSSQVEFRKEKHRQLVDYLSSDKCFTVADKNNKPFDKRDDILFSFNEKGIFYINTFFFERERGIL